MKEVWPVCVVRVLTEMWLTHHDAHHDAPFSSATPPELFATSDGKNLSLLCHLDEQEAILVLCLLFCSDEAHPIPCGLQSRQPTTLPVYCLAFLWHDDVLTWPYSSSALIPLTAGHSHTDWPGPDGGLTTSREVFLAIFTISNHFVSLWWREGLALASWSAGNCADAGVTCEVIEVPVTSQKCTFSMFVPVI